MDRKQNAEAAETRHRRIYEALRRTAAKVVTRSMRFRGETVSGTEGPLLILANHNTDLDPVLVGSAVQTHLYFVASEHLFRKGWISSVVEWAFGPIHRMKGSTDASAALDILRRIRRGNSVCMFPEGNRSYNGLTGPVFPATGKLVRSSGATMVTYRMEGGYLAAPRWSRSRRRGPIRGRVAGVYPPAALRAMTSDEINERIERDLHEDAFATQAAFGDLYPGKALAEYLESALFICPECGKPGEMKSRGDVFACGACGFEVRYGENGRFYGTKVPFETVAGWDAWQADRLKELARGGIRFEDRDAILSRWDPEGTERIASGILAMDADSLSVGDTRFPLSGITGFGLIARARINFTFDGCHYEIASGDPAFCARKYHLLFGTLSDGRTDG